VYGGSVSVVTTRSLAHLAAELAAPVQDARFRATVTLDVDDLPAFAEDDWAGRRLRLGVAEIEVRGRVPRCAVIDMDPTSGRRDLEVMKALPGLHGRGVEFGVDAVVIVPGLVRTGDRAVLR
jgi:uncharacterized protein YcbX